MVSVEHTWHRLKAGLLGCPGAEHQNSYWASGNKPHPPREVEAIRLLPPVFIFGRVSFSLLILQVEVLTTASRIFLQFCQHLLRKLFQRIKDALARYGNCFQRWLALDRELLLQVRHGQHIR